MYIDICRRGVLSIPTGVFPVDSNRSLLSIVDWQSHSGRNFICTLWTFGEFALILSWHNQNLTRLYRVPRTFWALQAFDSILYVKFSAAEGQKPRIAESLHVQKCKLVVCRIWKMRRLAECLFRQKDYPSQCCSSKMHKISEWFPREKRGFQPCQAIFFTWPWASQSALPCCLVRLILPGCLGREPYGTMEPGRGAKDRWVGEPECGLGTRLGVVALQWAAGLWWLQPRRRRVRDDYLRDVPRGVCCRDMYLIC